jgi:hypothetical protein
VRQNLRDDLGIFDAGDHLERPAAAGAGVDLDAERAVQADVTISRSTSITGVGAMAVANMTGTSKTTISGNKSRTDDETKMQSKVVGFLARNTTGPSAEIVLLDQDTLYHVNFNKKEYTETTFEQMRAQMQKAQDQLSSNGDKSQPSAVDQSKCEWLPPSADVNKTGEKAQIAGYDSERVIVTAKQPCKDKDTGSICEVALVLDQWLSTGFAENAEARQFYKAYAAKMGLDLSSPQDASQKAKAMFSQYKGIWTEVAAKMQNVKGYPVRSGFTLALGGPQCKDSRSNQAQASQTDDSSGGSGNLAGAVAGKLGGLFHKKSDDAETPSAAPPGTPVVLPAGDVALMTVSSQLVSISTDTASADAFTVPANFKKIEMKTQ